MFLPQNEPPTEIHQQTKGPKEHKKVPVLPEKPKGPEASLQKSRFQEKFGK